MRWLICDTTYNAEAYTFGHLDSYGFYIAAMGEEVDRLDWAGHVSFGRGASEYDVVFALDGYAEALKIPSRVHIAQVACDTDVPTGFDAVISSIPALVEKYKARGDNAIFQALCFDTRARVCGMGVTRDLGCVFIGTTGPNHKRRTALLHELRDVVTVLPPTFGASYFKTLARAKAVFSPHAEWAQGAINNMRMFEAAGMGAVPIADGEWPAGTDNFGEMFDGTASDARDAIRIVLEADGNYVPEWNLPLLGTYESRIPRLVEIARSL